MSIDSKCTCIIRLDNPSKVYYAGQLVSGTTELTTASPKTIRSMQVAVNGFAEVLWNETSIKKTQDGKYETVPEDYTAIEQYLSSQIYVFGSSAGGSLTLAPGRYVYPFQAAIPAHAPSSMNGKWGQIRYDVTFTIDCSPQKDIIFKKAFTVLSPLDLNFSHSYTLPIEREERKEFCCAVCCSGNDPMHIKVNIPFSGFAPGTKLPIRILIDNESSSRCTEVKAKLLRLGKYTCRNPSTKHREDELKVVGKSFGSVEALMKKEFDEFLEIPSTTPSISENCGVIKISYQLRITIKVSGLHTDLDIDIPIVIGTVPFQQSILNNKVQQPIVNQPGSVPNGQIVPSKFEEDVNKTNFLSSKKGGHSNCPDFIPKYPVFSTSVSPAPIQSQQEPSFPPGNQQTTSAYPHPTQGANAYPAPLPQAGIYPSPPAVYPPQPGTFPPQPTVPYSSPDTVPTNFPKTDVVASQPNPGLGWKLN